MAEIKQASTKVKKIANENHELKLSRVRVLRIAACIAILVISISYLIFKTYQVSDRPGFDFKYIWLAGDLWLEGANPYGSEYMHEGELRISQGHVPIMWVYPPSWWPIATPFGFLDLYSANVVWNTANIILIIITSAMLSSLAVRNFSSCRKSDQNRSGKLQTFLVFCPLVFLIATLEATGILFSVGQTTLLICLGVTMMLWGRIHNIIWVGALGLALVMLKPQIGLPFALLSVFDKIGRKTIFPAILISAGFAAPAFIQTPTVLLDFLDNLLAYDGFTDANLPQSMTGARLLIWELSAIDIGNIKATVLTLVAISMLCLGPTRVTYANDPDIMSWKVFALSTAVIIAFAPLHIYDFVLIVVALPFLVSVKWPERTVAITGMLMIWRSENLAALTAFHSQDNDIFPGSRLAMIGAMLFFLGILGGVLRRDGRQQFKGIR